MNNIPSNLIDRLQLIGAVDSLYNKRIKQWDRAIASVKREIEEYFSDINSECIHYIKSRIKSRESILGKARKEGYNNPIDELDDIAGIRIVCHNKSDVSEVAEFIKSRYAKSIIKDKIIKKNDGYNARHIVVKVKPLIGGEPRDTMVEMQLRTIAEDLFGTLSHRDIYKLSINLPESWQKKMKNLGEKLEEVDAIAEDLKQSWISENIKTKTKDILTAQAIIRICEMKYKQKLTLREGLYCLSQLIEHDIKKISEFESILQNDFINMEIDKIYSEIMQQKAPLVTKIYYGAIMHGFMDSDEKTKEKVLNMVKDTLKSILEVIKPFKQKTRM